ncbi:YoaK family protein [Paenibacillus rigui]|uniref:DUF1275 family protein n=1 Tax=Paenibacillus rigui TaxID=554312 RepID=A0A229UVP4_9BACL|nr:YoaK family protein [Paenibacillus rigui]OXM87677.1 hypothetical protein CF651_00725 [Paenibacillus rigui]
MNLTSCRNGLLLLLCLTGGLVDVMGYLGLGHVFTANMTGNIVLLGMALGHAEGLAVLRTVTALVGFIAGIAIAAVVVGPSSKDKDFWPSRVTVALGMEGFFLLLFAVASVVPPPSGINVYFLIVMLSTAMGIQTTVARRLGIAGISTTVLTNNLAHVVEDTMHQCRFYLRGDARSAYSPDSVLRLLAIVIYGSGAVLAAALMRYCPVVLLWLPVAFFLVIIGTVLVRFRSTHRQG